MNKEDFEIIETDRWGTVWVRCPLCDAIKKNEGILKHIIRMAQNNDTEHSLWLEKNYAPSRGRYK